MIVDKASSERPPRQHPLTPLIMLKIQLQIENLYRFRRNVKFAVVFATITLLALFHSMKETDNGRSTIFSLCFLTCDRHKIQRPEVCRIPKLNPFHPSIRHLIKPPKSPKCEKKFALLFNSTLDSYVVPLARMKDFRKLKIKSCCYHTVERGHHIKMRDIGYIQSEKCYRLSLKNATKIPEEHEFIVISCRKLDQEELMINQMLGIKEYVNRFNDMHAFVPRKPEVMSRMSESKPPSADRLNVVIFGMDAISRMNFIRTMPKTHAYLKGRLKAVELRGYNKIGDNTFPNIVPLLTSLPTVNMTVPCEVDKLYDSCPLIWKNFSKAGYATSFAEDSPKVAIFNYLKSGFDRQPTDYYLRPFANAADVVFSREQKSPCQGPRLAFQNLLDYLKKFVHLMGKKNRPYFSFTWSTSLSHNFLTYPTLGDLMLRETLEWFHDTGHLENTVIILMSDHGIRYGEIRKYPQGQIEERLPFMYLLFPKAFQRKYGNAHRNLRWNVGRLVTSLDLYYTLADILNPSQIENENLYQRGKQLSILEEKSQLPKGISLFLRIPTSRTCSDTIIEENFCMCNPLKEIAVDDVVKEGAEFAVAEINRRVENHRNCARLSLLNIRIVQKTRSWKSHHDRNGSQSYLINFDTNPGPASFEVLVTLIKKPRRWVMSSSISRTNLYGNQSHCVNDKTLKYFCYCIT